MIELQYAAFTAINALAAGWATLAFKRLGSKVDSVSLIPGPQGDPGKTGATGAMGPKGEPGEFSQGPSGAEGRPGKDGRDGEDGRPGRDGRDGRPGLDAPASAPTVGLGMKRPGVAVSVNKGEAQILK